MDALKIELTLPPKAVGIMAGKYFNRLIGYIILGLVINIGMLLTSQDAFGSLKNIQTFDTSMSEAIFVLVVILAFPLIYIVLGHRQGISAAGYYAAKKYRTTVVELLLKQTFKAHPEWMDDLQHSAKLIKERLQNMGKVMKKANFVQRLAFQQIANFFSKILRVDSIEATLDDAIAQAEKWGQTHETKLTKLSEVLASKLDIEKIKPRLSAPLVTIAVNMSAVYLLAPVIPKLIELIQR